MPFSFVGVQITKYLIIISGVTVYHFAQLFYSYMGKVLQDPVLEQAPGALSQLRNWVEFSVSLGILLTVLFILFKEYKAERKARAQSEEKYLEMNIKLSKIIAENTQALNRFRDDWEAPAIQPGKAFKDDKTET